LISKYGYDVVGAVIIVVVLGSAISWYVVEWKLFKFALIVGLLLFLIFTLNFFRDPDRVTPPGDGLVISPADGRVVLIKEVREDEYLKGEAIQISIFMSPLNVHVNRHPINGTVEYYKYFPGSFFAAFEEKSSLRNEQAHIGLINDKMKVLLKQIAGFVARRIVTHVQVGDAAVAGERFGMIKFGSRVDVLMPRGTTLKVTLGDRTVAGETVLAAAS